MRWPGREKPEAVCPACGSAAVRWREPSLLTRLRLAATTLLERVAAPLLPVRLRCETCHAAFSHLHTPPRTVIGYHGCRRDFARRLVAGRVPLEEWRASENEYDWLGKGIYFWEYAPGRAWQWARERFGEQGAVVAAVVRLGRCFDLADTEFTELFEAAYRGILRLFQEEGRTLPDNRGAGAKLRKLDRLVIDRLLDTFDRRADVTGRSGGRFQTIRCPFEEGEEVFPGSMIRKQSHVQIAVRDSLCIDARVHEVPSPRRSI